MAHAPTLVRSLAALACLAASAGPSLATDMPAYAPVQTERELSFVSVTLGLKDRIAAMQQRTADPMRIEYALLDLDADGQGEVFIRIHGGPACATGSCITMVFNMASGNWVKVLETGEADVTVAKQAHRGYRDIIVGSQPLLWTGKAYGQVR